MRVPALSILVLAALALASDTHAQTPLNDPFVELIYKPSRSDFHQTFDFPHIPFDGRGFQTDRILAFDEDGRPVLPMGGSWYVSGHADTYRPVETMRMRSEGVGFTRELRFGTITIGAERSKLTLEGLPRLRTLDYGFRLRIPF